MAAVDKTTPCGGGGDDGGSTASSTCSADTQEAFLEMLGLPELGGISIMDEAENDSAVDAPTMPMHVECESNNSPDRLPPSVSRLEVPHRCSRYLHHPSDVAAFVIDDFLDASECQELIRLATALSGSGFHYVTEAVHTDSEGVTHIVKLQEANKHKLSVFEHPLTLDKLWMKMQPVVLPHIDSFVENTRCGPPLGLNPRLRVLRYDASDRDVFEPHFDATTKVGEKTSLLTVLIYLNDGGGQDFGGGETCYLDYHVSRGIDTATKITPATGKVVVFEHDLFHSSLPLEFGCKYVLRTDILFDLDASEGGVERPRGKSSKKEAEDAAGTLLELCRRLGLSEEDQTALDEMGMLDLTLESLFAPGVSAVRQMMRDALNETDAERLVNAALECR